MGAALRASGGHIWLPGQVLETLGLDNKVLFVVVLSIRKTIEIFPIKVLEGILTIPLSMSSLLFQR